MDTIEAEQEDEEEQETSEFEETQLSPQADLSDTEETITGEIQFNPDNFREKFFAKGGGKPPLSLDQYFVPGKSILEGLCEVQGKLGEGGMCNAYRVVPELWEVLRNLMLNGDIPPLTNSIGIKMGEKPSTEQFDAVNERIAKWKRISNDSQVRNKTGLDRIMLDKHVHRKLRNAGEAALKAMKPAVAKETSEGSRNVQRFEQEAFLMQYEFDCDQIIKGYLYFKVDGYHCFLEEIVEGAESLDKTLMTGRNIPIQASTKICSEALKAILHSHDKGVVWRDCAPKNILVRWNKETGEAEIIRATDWGIAKTKTGKGGIESLIHDSTTTDLGETKTGDLVATPSYASPEQLKDSKNVDYPTDFFSLGIMYYRLTAGTLPFIGSNVVQVMERITSTESEKIPIMPNLSIAERRGTITENLKARHGSVDESKLPKYISDEMEDLIMMLMEKDEAKRIRRHHIVRLFGEIEKKELYEMQEVSEEEAEANESRQSEILNEIRAKESHIKGSAKSENLAEKLEIAELYAELGRITPRETGEGVMPDLNREIIFRNAIIYSRMVHDNFQIGSVGLPISKDEIEDIIHMLECRYSVEQIRVDQYALEIESEKPRVEIRPKPEFNDGEGGTPEKPGLGANLFSFGSKRKAYKRQEEEHTADLERWGEEVNAFADSILESVLRFINKGKYIAAKKKFEEAKRFCDEHEVSIRIYQRKDVVGSELECEKGYSELAFSILSQIEEMKRSTAKKRFANTEKAIIEVNRRIGELSREDMVEKYGYIQELFGAEVEIYEKAKLEHDKFVGLVAKTFGLTQIYKLLEARLKEGETFGLDELRKASQESSAIDGKIGIIDRRLVGAEYHDELNAMFSASQENFRRIAATHAGMTYQRVEAGVAKLEEITSSIGDKGSVKGGTEQLAEAREIIESIKGEMGRENISAKYLEGDSDKLGDLDRRIKVQEARKTIIAGNIGRFVKLVEQSKSDDEASRGPACAELSDIHIREQGDIATALTYFEEVPVELRDPKRAAMFEAWGRTEDRDQMVRRTPEGLDETYVKGLDIERDPARYKITNPERDDTAFDRYLMRVCQGMGADPEEILSVRRDIDELVKLSNSDGPEAEQAKVKLEAKTTNFYEAVKTLVTEAYGKLTNEGIGQPMDVEDYARIASALETVHPGLSAAYYAKFLQRLPANHPEVSDVKQRIARLDEMASSA